jgi:hypothetical protein
MADPNDPSKPLGGAEAKRLALANLLNGTTIITPYTQRRQNERDIETQDIENTLKGEVFQFAEWNQQAQENRYRFETSRMGVVVAFDSEDETLVTVVTTWRKT